MYDCSADTGLFCQSTNVGKSDSYLAGHISLWCSWLWRCLIGFNGYCQKDTASTDAGRTMLCSLSLSFCRFCPIMSAEAWISSCEVPSLRITAPTTYLSTAAGPRRGTSPNAFGAFTMLEDFYCASQEALNTLYAWIVMSSANALLELLRLFCCWAKFGGCYRKSQSRG